MNVTSRNLLLILTVVLLVVTPVLFWLDFLCVEGFLSGVTYYGIILIGLAILRTGNVKLKDLSLNALIFLPVLYVFAIPIVMLSKSISIGGYEFFLNERLYQYIYLMSTALLILVLSSALYAKERGLYAGKLRAKLLSPLSIALVARICWLTLFETRHLAEFALNAPHLKVEYVVLVSIPLFLAVLILTIGRILSGYILGFFLGLAHVLLVLLMVAMGQNPGVGPIVVSLASLAICIFSVKGVMAYHFNNNIELPVIGQFIMGTVLRIRRNPRKNQKMLELGGVRGGDQVLDYGCGVGNYTIETAKIVGESGTVIAADISNKMLQGLGKHISASGLSNISPVLINSMEDIEASDFDFILLIDVLHLIEDKTATVDFLLEKLADDGKLFVKFEHFTNEQIAAVLNSCRASGSKLVSKDHWLLSKQPVKGDKNEKERKSITRLVHSHSGADSNVVHPLCPQAGARNTRFPGDGGRSGRRCHHYHGRNARAQHRALVL